MICQQPSMDRRRPHTGEKGRYGLPRSALLVVGCNMRDIEEALIRAICLSSKDQDTTLKDQAKLGTDAALHRNHLHTMYSEEIDILDLLDHMRDELEKLMAVYPNAYGEDLKTPQRRASDRRQPMTVSDNFDDLIGESLPEPNPYPNGKLIVNRVNGDREVYALPPPVAMRNGRPIRPDHPSASDEYDGWTEQQKIHGRMQALGIPVPRPSLWSRFKKWAAE